jgi:3'-5' exonuclease
VENVAGAADPLDPRVLAPLAVLERVPALLTCVPYAGELVREGSSSRRGTPFWAATMRVVDGPAAGAYAELRIWPQGRNRLWLLGRLATLTGLGAESIDALDDGARLAALREGLAGRSFGGSVEVASDGRLEVAFVDGAVDRIEPSPTLVEPAPHRRVSPLVATERPLLDAAAPFTLVTDRLALAAVCERVRSASIVAVDIETDCGPIGSPPEWEPSDGAVRLVQVAWPEGAGAACAVVDCYAVPADPLVRLLAEPGRTVVAHNIRYEQQWLSFHHGIPVFADPIDTSIAFRIFECIWALQDPGYVRQDARLETVARRVVGVDKGAYGLSFWGADPLAPEQLRYAALDALSLLDIARATEQIAAAFGCEDQLRAASRAACREAVRRLPAPRAYVLDELDELLASATTTDELERLGVIARRLSLGYRGRNVMRDAWRARRDTLRPKAA